MLLRRLVKNRNKRTRIAHIGAGIIILIHAYEKYESKHNSYKLFALAGFIFLIIASLHSLIEKKVPWVDGVFFLIEGALSIIVALDYFHLGKKALPFTYLLLGFFQFFIACRKSKKGIAEHKLSN